MLIHDLIASLLLCSDVDMSIPMILGIGISIYAIKFGGSNHASTD